MVLDGVGDRWGPDAAGELPVNTEWWRGLALGVTQIGVVDPFLAVRP